MISKITELFPTDTNLIKILVLDQLNDKDYSDLINEFNYGKSLIDKSLKIYRNIAIIIDLSKQNDDHSADWKNFISRHIPQKENPTKLDNVFVNKTYDKLLLITNRRLVTIDLKKLNEKIKKINTDIEVLNDSLEEEAVSEQKGFVHLIKRMFS